MYCFDAITGLRTTIHVDADWAAYFRGESGDPARVDPVQHDPVSAAEESQRAGDLGQAVSAAGAEAVSMFWRRH